MPIKYNDNNISDSNLNNRENNNHLNSERNIYNNYKVDKIYNASNDATYKSNHYDFSEVDQNDVISTVGTVGIKYHTEMSNGGTPMISLAINNELGDNTIDTTNTYQGGGTKFKTTTEVEELSATLGLGYSFGNDVTSLNLNYEANANEDDYISQYGSVKIVAKF